MNILPNDQYDSTNLLLDASNLIKSSKSQKKIKALTIELKEKNLINKRFGKEKSTLLGIAIRKNNHVAVKLLLEYGADVNKRSGLDNQKYTPIWLAIDKGNPKIIDLLLKNEADLTKRSTQYGCIPMALALSADKLSKKQLEQIKEKSVTFELEHQIKMLGLRFSLQPQPKEDLYFDGYISDLTFTEFISSIQKFSSEFAIDETKGPRWNKKMWKKVLNSLTAPSKLVADNYFSKKVVAFPVSYDGHLVAYAAYGKYVAKIDRATKQPGIKIHKTGKNLFHVSRKLQKLANSENITESEEKDIVDSIKLSQDPIYLPHSLQKTNNCCWVSFKLLFKTVVYFQLKKKGYKEEDAQAASHKVYKIWTRFDRNMYLAEVKKNPELLRKAAKYLPSEKIA